MEAPRSLVLPKRGSAGPRPSLPYKKHVVIGEKASVDEGTLLLELSKLGPDVDALTLGYAGLERAFEQGPSAVLLLSSCLSRLTQLRYLDLSSILLNNTLVGILASHVGGTLEHLSLARNPLVTDEGIAHVALHCHKLRSIDLSGCDGVTASGILLLMHPGALMGHAMNLVKRLMGHINISDLGVGAAGLYGSGSPTPSGPGTPPAGSGGYPPSPSDLVSGSDFMSMDAAVNEALRTQVMCSVFGQKYVEVAVASLISALRSGLPGGGDGSPAPPTSTADPAALRNMMASALASPSLLVSLGRAYRRAAWLDTGHPGALGPCLLSISKGKMLLVPGNNSDLASLSGRLLARGGDAPLPPPSGTAVAGAATPTVPGSHPAATAAAAAAVVAAGSGLDRALAGWSLMGWRHDDPALADIRLVTGREGVSMVKPGGEGGSGALASPPRMTGSLLVGIGFDAHNPATSMTVAPPPALPAPDTTSTSAGADTEGTGRSSGIATGGAGTGSASAAATSDAALLTGIGGGGTAGGGGGGIPPSTITTPVQVRLPVRGPLLCTVPMGAWPWSAPPPAEGDDPPPPVNPDAPPPGHDQPVTVVVPLPFPVQVLMDAKAEEGATSTEVGGDTAPLSALGSVAAASTAIPGAAGSSGGGTSPSPDSPAAGPIPHYTLPGLLPLPWAEDTASTKAGTPSSTAGASGGSSGGGGGGKRKRRGGKKKKKDSSTPTPAPAPAPAPSTAGSGSGSSRRRRRRGKGGDGGAGGSAAALPYNPLWGLQDSLPPTRSPSAKPLSPAAVEEVQAAALGRAMGQAIGGKLGAGVDFTLGMGLGGIESAAHYNLVSHQQRLVLYGQLLAKQDAYISEVMSTEEEGVGDAAVTVSKRAPPSRSALARWGGGLAGLGGGSDSLSAVMPYAPVGSSASTTTASGPITSTSSTPLPSSHLHMPGGSGGLEGVPPHSALTPQRSLSGAGAPSGSSGTAGGGYAGFAYAYASYLNGYATIGGEGGDSSPPARESSSGRPRAVGPPTPSRAAPLPLSGLFAGQLLLDSSLGSSSSLRTLGGSGMVGRGGVGAGGAGGVASAFGTLALSSLTHGGGGGGLLGGALDPMATGMVGSGAVGGSGSEWGGSGGDEGGLVSGGPPPPPPSVVSVSPFELAITASRALMDVQSSAARAGALGVSMMNIVAAGLAPVLRSHMTSRPSAGGGGALGDGLLAKAAPAPVEEGEGGEGGVGVAPAATPVSPPAGQAPAGDVLSELKPSEALPPADASDGEGGGSTPPEPFEIEGGLEGGEGVPEAGTAPRLFVLGRMDETTENSVVVAASAAAINMALSTPHPDEVRFEGGFDFGGMVGADGVALTTTGAAIASAATVMEARQLWMAAGEGAAAGGEGPPSRALLGDAGEGGDIAPLASALPVPLPRLMGFGLGAVGGPLKEVACPPLTSGEAVMVRRVAGAEAGHARARSGSGPALPSTVTVRCAEILTADGYDLPSRSLSPTTLSALQEPGAAYAVNQDIGLAFLPMPSGREPGAAAVAAAASGSVPVLSNVDIEFDDPTSLAYMVGDAQ